MSPPMARRAPSEAPWEITESECIDFSAENRGGSPDEELRRKCNNLILHQCPRTHPPARPGEAHGTATASASPQGWVTAGCPQHPSTAGCRTQQALCSCPWHPSPKHSPLDTNLYQVFSTEYYLRCTKLLIISLQTILHMAWKLWRIKKRISSLFRTTHWKYDIHIFPYYKAS